MSTHEPDGNTNRVIGTALQYNSTSILIKALKHDTISLQDLHYEISTKHYPVPTEKELCPTTTPTLFQNNQHPYTAFDDINSLTPQEIKYIMTTFCERFYPQVTKPIIQEPLNSTEEEIRQMLQSPHTIQNKIEKNGHKIDFNPPFVSILRAPQHKAND